jgi:hypothetical protein
MRTKFYGLRIGMLYQRIERSKIRFCLNLIVSSYLFILVAVRCIRILNLYFGGQKWRKRLLLLLPVATTVVLLRLFAWKRVYFNLCQTLVGSGRKWVWILSLDFHLLSKGSDSIWVIVDRLMKVARFIPVRTKYHLHQYVELYFEHIVRQYGVPRTTISDRGQQFTARFWECLHQQIGTHLVWSSAYHPQTTGQTERVNQILEDMLRSFVLSSQGS